MFRKISLTLTAIAAGLFILSSCSGNKKPENGINPDDQQLYIGEDIAVAQTQYGKIRGYILRNVYTFLGVPYGASTAGENRFLGPQPPQPWEDVLPTVFWGDSAPQRTANRWPNTVQTFADHWNYYDFSEDCLRLNVWTPGLDAGKRPVLVWIHGGGFTSGSGIEQDGYDGENLSREGNVVFVSLNHRLGPIGFTDFSAVDQKFADSGNAGILDIVAALKWVRDNIANFGGDPSNVTIMGQSGGGAKVCTLVAMSGTQGLFSKAVALSGNVDKAIDSNFSTELGKYIYKKAGSNMKKLQEMPWAEYLDFANAAAAEYMKDHPNGMMRGAFGPVGDGFNLPMGTFFQDTNLPSNKIPMIFCATTPEWTTGRMIGGPAAKIAQDAPVWVASFGFNAPLFDGKKGPFHCMDICFWFRNTDKMLTHTGGGARPRALADKMSASLLSFMRTGNPNTPALPEWPEWSESGHETMYLDDECKVLSGSDGVALK